MNEMIDKTLEAEVLEFEREMSAVTGLFSSDLLEQYCDSPAEAVIDSIHTEARRSALRRRFRSKIRFLMRLTASVAAIFLLYAGLSNLQAERDLNRHRIILNQLCIVSSEEEMLPNREDATSTAALAALLLQMQGLDEESYFTIN
jgi:hypothetical protein